LAGKLYSRVELWIVILDFIDCGTTSSTRATASS
jgi:hypothetical protein